MSDFPSEGFASIDCLDGGSIPVAMSVAEVMEAIYVASMSPTIGHNWIRVELAANSRAELERRPSWISYSSIVSVTYVDPPQVRGDRDVDERGDRFLDAPHAVLHPGDRVQAGPV